jgi:hypothetical protein
MTAMPPGENSCHTEGGMTDIFHITHVDNLPGIAAEGLVCDTRMSGGNRSFQSIAYPGLKLRRAQTVVPCPPGGTLADYVPFYFCPRSPMLYTINQGNVGSVAHGQRRIVHLRLELEAVAAVRPFVFTTGHAIIVGLSTFHNDLRALGTLDWQSIQSNQWGSNYDASGEQKRKKQSEFLALDHVPWELVQEIGVHSQATAGLAAQALAGVAHQPRVGVRADWYY